MASFNPCATIHPMNKQTPKRRYTTIDEYIDGFPADIRSKLKKMRVTIRREAPQAEEAIKYGIPTFVLGGNLVHFAAFARHIGFYPTSSGIAEFSSELKDYVTAKGSVQFPLDKPIPYDIVARIVRFRVGENSSR